MDPGTIFFCLESYSNTTTTTTTTAAAAAAAATTTNNNNPFQQSIKKQTISILFVKNVLQLVLQLAAATKEAWTPSLALLLTLGTAGWTT